MLQRKLKATTVNKIGVERKIRNPKAGNTFYRFGGKRKSTFETFKGHDQKIKEVNDQSNSTPQVVHNEETSSDEDMFKVHH